MAVAASTDRPAGARRALVVLGLAVTVAFTYLALRNARLSEVADALVASEKLWLLPAFALLAVTVAMRAARWRAMFEPGARPPFGAVLHATLVGLFFNNVLPLRAGEAARVLALHRSTRRSRAETAGTVALERAFDVLALLVLLVVLVPWLPSVTWLRAAVALLVGLAAAVAVAAVLLLAFGERPLRAALRPLGRLVAAERLDRGAAALVQGLGGLRRPRVAVEGAGLTVGSWLVLGLSFWCVMLGFDLGLAPVAGMLAVIATNLALVLPSSPAAVGVFEWATIVALGAYGIDESRALSYALLVHAVNVVPFLVAGPFLLRAVRR